jgi:hypothetical protein
MVALMGVYSIFHALISVIIHGGRHIMGCIGANPAC